MQLASLLTIKFLLLIFMTILIFKCSADPIPEGVSTTVLWEDEVVQDESFVEPNTEKISEFNEDAPIDAEGESFIAQDNKVLDKSDEILDQNDEIVSDLNGDAPDAEVLDEHTKDQNNEIVSEVNLNPSASSSSQTSPVSSISTSSVSLTSSATSIASDWWLSSTTTTLPSSPSITTSASSTTPSTTTPLSSTSGSHAYTTNSDTPGSSENPGSSETPDSTDSADWCVFGCGLDGLSMISGMVMGVCLFVCSLVVYRFCIQIRARRNPYRQL